MYQDILTIDEKMREYFDRRKKLLPQYKKELKQLEEINHLHDLSPSIKTDISFKLDNLKEKIYDTENEIDLGFYTAESVPLLEKYREILKQPEKVSFTSKKVVENPEKFKIIDNYLKVAGKYVDLKIDPIKTLIKKIICENCGNGKEFQIEENNYVCQKCGTVQDVEVHSTSYSDIERVNMSSKYSYDRKGHFRDIIHTYQGKEKYNVDKEVLVELTEKLQLYKLLDGDPGDVKEIRFKRVTRFHVLEILRQLGHDKAAEHSFLVHWKLTGQTRNDISHLETKLMEDFSTLEKLYFFIYKDENNVERSSFINNRQIFYQLLLKHKYHCSKEDFSLLKTIDRLALQDSITEGLFKELGWKYVSLF